jgi:hypothetical protein
MKSLFNFSICMYIESDAWNKVESKSSTKDVTISVIQTLKTKLQIASGHDERKGNDSDLYAGDSRFEPWPGHQLV